MAKRIRVYLDNCTFNRPFDNQGQIRIRLEAEAKFFIQHLIKSGGVELIWSYVLDFENSQNPFHERRAYISSWRTLSRNLVEESSGLLEDANMFKSIGLKSKDALHIASAKAGNADYFITTDDQILKNSEKIETVTILDPISFVKIFDKYD